MTNKFQNEDFKSQAELVAAGGTKAQLLNTTKVYSPKTTNDLETDLRKNNDVGTVAPAVGNDSSQGYEPGSRWIDTVAQKTYFCISNSVGAAVWKEAVSTSSTGSGIGGVDILATDTADSAVLADYTQTGLEIITTPIILHGTKTFRLVHQAASTRSFKKVIAVDRKFRGKQMTLEMDNVSSALMANLTLAMQDETNSVAILASSQIQTDSQSITATVTNTSLSLTGLSITDYNKLKLGMLITGPGIPTGTRIDGLTPSTLTATLSQAATSTSTSTKSISALTTKRKFSFTIPEGCASLSWTISALAEANSPESYIDDLLIQLTSSALTSTSISQQTTTTDTVRLSTANGFGSTNTGAARLSTIDEQTSNGVLSYIDSAALGATFTALKACEIKISARGTGGATSATMYITKNATVLTAAPPDGEITSATSTGSGFNFTAEASFLVNAGDVVRVQRDSTNLPSVGKIVITATSVVAATTNIPLTSTILLTTPDSMLRLNTGNGYGSSNPLVIRRFANITSNIGNDIQYTDSPTLGAFFTILTAGEYYISYTDLTGGINETIGLSLNTTQPTQGINLLSNVAEILSMQTSVSAGVPTTTAWHGTLNVGDVVRAHNNVSASANNSKTQFTISKAGSIKQINQSSDQKIQIPTHQLRFEGASARGSTDTAAVKFDTQALTIGDGFTVVNTAANGTVVTITKAGRLTVDANLNVNNVPYAITLNETNLITYTRTAGITLAESNLGAGVFTSISKTFDVKVGDKIRIMAGGAPTALASNSFTLCLQEQTVAVALQNVTPTFTDAGSNIHVAQANGKGSTNTPIRRFSNLVQNLGTDVTYTDSAALGGSFTINTSDFYIISFSDQSTGAATNFFGISKNTSQPTTDFNSLSDGSGLTQTEIPSGDDYKTGAWAGYLSKNDVLRLHGTAAAMVSTNAGNARTHFSIIRIGKPALTLVDVTPFVNTKVTDIEAIEANLGTNNSTFGSTNTGVPVWNISRYTNLGVIQIISDSVNGTSFKALKDCVLSISAGSNAAAGNSGVVITRNSTLLTATNPDGMIASVFITSSTGADTTAVVKANANDIFRIQRNSTNISSVTNLTILATADNGAVTTPTQQISSDTMTFNFKATTLTTSDPIGTYNTYKKAVSQNYSPTLCTTAPTQTASDINLNGFRLFATAYNAASSDLSPSAVEIFIGTGLKAKQVDAYFTSSKVTQLVTDLAFNTNTDQFGAQVNYNEVTGILRIEVGDNYSSATTARFLKDNTNTNRASGYFVFSASKTPSLVTIPYTQPRIAIIKDIRSNSTNGGTFTSGAYQTRTLNTLTDPFGIVTSLISNQFTLPAGTYKLTAYANAFETAHHKAKLKNITDSIDTIIGSSEGTTQGATVQTTSFVMDVFTITSPKTFEIQHRNSLTESGDGFGWAAIFGDNEVYTQVEILKIK